MNFKTFILFPIIIVMFGTVIFGSFNAAKVDAFSEQIIQRGATGDDVIELQSRLQYNGYYHGTIDGVYGWSTYWAVRNFQKAFGLTEVDGLVGHSTKDMLIRATKYNQPFVYDNLKKGNRFTHYGGVPWKIQSAPSQETIEKAKKSAEKMKIAQEQQYQAQGQGENQQDQQHQGQGQKQQNKQQAGQEGEQNQGQQQQNHQHTKQQGQQQHEHKGQQQAQQQGQQQHEHKGQQQAQQQGQQQHEHKGQQQAQQQGQQNQEQTQEQQKQQPQTNQQPPQEQQQEPEPKAQKKQPETPQQEEKQGPTAANMPGGFSQNDIQLMANAVYGEARGEEYIGQVAIAAVILNRLNSPTFPNTVSGVIFEPLAFTAVADGQIWLTPNEQAKKAVLDAVNGYDPTGNATYYFNPDTATSKWIWGRPQIKRIGKHIFAK